MDWATFMGSFSCPDDDKRLYFKKKHKSTTKYIEQAFSILKKRWSKIAQLARLFRKGMLANIMYTCNILHNMLIEDSGRGTCQDNYNDVGLPTALLNNDERLCNLLKIQNMEKHLSSIGFGRTFVVK